MDALAQLAETHKDRLFWVLGIDLTHLGRRYGNPFTALANQGRMAELRSRIAAAWIGVLRR